MLDNSPHAPQANRHRLCPEVMPVCSSRVASRISAGLGQEAERSLLTDTFATRPRRVGLSLRRLPTSVPVFDFEDFLDM